MKVMMMKIVKLKIRLLVNNWSKVFNFLIIFNIYLFLKEIFILFICEIIFIFFSERIFF